MAGLRRRPLIAGAAAVLLLLQAFALIISPYARAALAPGDQGIVLAVAGELCDAGAGDGGTAPVPQHHHQHCTLCVAGKRNSSLGGLGDAAVFLVATVIALATPQSEATPLWPDHDDQKLSPSGWGSSWSSRAPPSFS